MWLVVPCRSQQHKRPQYDDILQMSAMTRSSQPPPPAPPLRHSASFSCLSRGSNRERPHRARTATLPTACADTDYGFVVRPRGGRGPAASVAMRLSVKYGNTSVMVLEEETENEDVTMGRSRAGTKKENQTSLRGVLMKKSASLLSPQAWWPPRSRRARATKDELENSVVETPPCDAGPQRRWRSLGALMRIPPASLPQSHHHHPQQDQAVSSSTRAQSFYLLDDFLRPQQNCNGKPQQQQQQQQRYLPEFREARLIFNGNNNVNMARRETHKQYSGGANTSSSDSLELSSPVPPPVPPPPPPLRLLGYRDCGCRQCRRDRQLLAPAVSEDRLHRFDTVLTTRISLYVLTGHAVSMLVVVDY